jgi:hypothetical protein
MEPEKMNRKQLNRKAFSFLLLLSLLAVLCLACVPVHAQTTDTVYATGQIPSESNERIVDETANTNSGWGSSVSLVYSLGDTIQFQTVSVSGSYVFSSWWAIVSGSSGSASTSQNYTVISPTPNTEAVAIYTFYSATPTPTPAPSTTYMVYASGTSDSQERIVDSTTSTASAWGTSESLTYSLGDTVIFESVPSSSIDVFDSWNLVTGSGAGGSSSDQNYTVVSPTPNEHAVAIYSLATLGMTMTYEINAYVSGFSGLLIDETTGAANASTSGSPAVVLVYLGDQVELQANEIAGYNFDYFMVDGANVGQGFFNGATNMFSYDFYPSAGATEYAYYSVATNTPTPAPTATPPSTANFNPTAFRSDMTAVLELIIGVLLTFGGVFVLIKAPSAWIIGVIVLLAGFFTLIVGEPNLYGLVAWALSITIFGVFSYSGVQKPK